MTKELFNKIKFEVLDENVIRGQYGYQTQYEVELTYKGESYSTTYTDSVAAYKNGEEINFKDFMYCILSDMSCFETCEDIDDFQANFGYEKASELLKAYNGCKETSEALHRIFTDEELEELQKEFEDY